MPAGFRDAITAEFPVIGQSADMAGASTTLKAIGGRLPVAGGIGLGILSLIVANAGLLFLYFVFELTPFQLVLAFWCECVWVGLYSAFKLIGASMFGDPYTNRWANFTRGGAVLTSIVVIGLVSGSFFSLLGLLLLLILGAVDQLPPSSGNDDALALIGVGLGASCLFLVSHGVSFLVNFVFHGEFRHARAFDLVTLPFKRCLSLFVMIVLSFAIVLLIPGLANTAGFGAAVISLKLIWDARLHFRERRTFADTTPGSAA